eukprot:10620423-Alexandrium_andersonii.AAC.1
MSTALPPGATSSRPRRTGRALRAVTPVTLASSAAAPSSAVDFGNPLARRSATGGWARLWARPLAGA